MTIHRRQVKRKYQKKSTRARKVKLSKKARIKNAISSWFSWGRGT